MDIAERIRRTTRDIPDFPSPGIVFKDFTTVMKDPALLRDIIKELASFHKAEKPDYIIGIESRGFIFGAPLAIELGCGFVPVRKRGKLPYKCIRTSYSLEYGEAVIEMHEDALEAGSKVVIVDDILATGGTIRAAMSLSTQLSAQILATDFIAELAFLKGRSKITGCAVNSLCVFD